MNIEPAADASHAPSMDQPLREGDQIQAFACHRCDPSWGDRPIFSVFLLRREYGHVVAFLRPAGSIHTHTMTPRRASQLRVIP